MKPARIGFVFKLPDAVYDINHPSWVPVAGGRSI
jgi:hypothetical protein